MRVWAINGNDKTVALLCDASSELAASASLLLPARSVLEKSGLLMNRAGRLQYAERCIDFPQGSEPHWRIISKFAKKKGVKVWNAAADRELTLAYLNDSETFSGISIKDVKAGGVQPSKGSSVDASSGGESNVSA